MSEMMTEDSHHHRSHRSNSVHCLCEARTLMLEMILRCRSMLEMMISCLFKHVKNYMYYTVILVQTPVFKIRIIPIYSTIFGKKINFFHYF